MIFAGKAWPGENVVVFGLGGIGLKVIQGARIGAPTRSSASISVRERIMAATFGMTIMNPREVGRDKVAQAWSMLTGGGADFWFECAGNPARMPQALECCRRGWGERIIIGVAASGAEISTRPFQLVTGRM